MFIPGGSAIETGGYNINNSLRLRSSASAWLNRTFSSTGNRKIWTFSAWVKRGQLGTAQMILCGYSGSSTELTNLQFNSNDTLEYYYDNGATNYRFTTSQVFRDSSAWYHIVLAVDTTQATNTNRAKLYVNGSQVTAFSTYETFPQNSDTFVNGAWGHGIGKYIYPGQTRYVDGYLAEVNFVNAQQLTPSSFGATDAITGVWAPAAYTGSYGTNGFYLKFSDIATTSGSNAGLGKDFSGNGNYWTTNNISVTSGTTYDAMTDSPTLTSATTANYAVINPLDVTTATISNANLTMTSTSAAHRAIRASIGISSGKWYWEQVFTGVNQNGACGVGTNTASLTTYVGGDANSWGYYSANGFKYNNGSGTSYGATYAANDIIGIAFDADAGTLVFYKNNVSQGTAYTLTTGVTYYPMLSQYNSDIWNINFGQRPFAYTPPTGFNRLNTFNLPNSTIVKGNTVMDATTYTGNSTTGRTISTNFYADFIWTKSRNVAYSNSLFDSVRGAGQSKNLVSNTTEAEGGGNSVYGNVSAFGSSAYTLAAGTDSGNPYANNNESGKTYVGWLWQAGQGTNTTNTAGSITTTTSVNATAGFSIISWTSTGSNGTIGHGLGVAPVFIIARRRNTIENWIVYHKNMGGNNGYLLLNDTGAFATGVAPWNSTNPTSSVISINNSAMGAGTSNPMITYAWAEIAGFSSFGSYTGNGSADGPFVFTGFMPKYLMIKSSSIAGEWAIYDVPRDLYNPMGLGGGRLRANTAAAETSADSAQYIDFLSNGFKIRNTSGFDNQSGATYIYMAFASNPFKNSNAF